MDQKKIGKFLQELRKEKGLTQEQVATQFNTTNRTISRWETGSNTPDISMLVEIAEFYGVDVREIIDGERKTDTMEKEVREVAEKAFKDGFNENSKKVKIADSDAKYRFDVKITNLDKYYGVMSLVPGYKHKAWGTITVVDVLTNATVCEMTFEELTGGRDFAIDDSFIKCMSDLGKAVAKTK